MVTTPNLSDVACSRKAGFVAKEINNKDGTLQPKVRFVRQYNLRTAWSTVKMNKPVVFCHWLLLMERTAQKYFTHKYMPIPFCQPLSFNDTDILVIYTTVVTVRAFLMLNNTCADFITVQALFLPVDHTVEWCA